MEDAEETEMVVVDPLLPQHPPPLHPPPRTPSTSPTTPASTSPGQSIQERARDFIARKKRLAESESESVVQSEPASSTYNSIYVLRNKTTDCQNLHGGKGGAKACNIGSFYNKGDSRMDTCTVRSIFKTKLNISFTFDPASFDCQLCQAKHVVAGPEASRQIFVLADQCFPPMLDLILKATVFKS
jgi:hypothetical protein